MATHPTGLRALAAATLIAFAAVTAYTAPVAATDPSPSAAATATVDPSASATPSAPSTSATAAPAAPTADASASPAVTLTLAASDPAASTTPASVAPTPAPPAASTTPAAPKVSVRALIVRVALAQRGKRYVLGASGPRAFDCSGLVRYAYQKAGVLGRIGGGHSARGMYLWARRHGLTSRSNPQVGDLVIYGGGTHVAIYIGRGLVVSALNPRQGIRVTGLHALRGRVTAFIHTRI